MIITISPTGAVPGHPETHLFVAGDTITVDGIAYDLSAVPEGGQAMPGGGNPFIGVITRIGGEIICTINCIYDAATADPIQPAPGAHWVVDVSDGPVTLPIIRQEAEA